MSRQKLIWSLVAALPLAVFGGWTGLQTVANAGTGTATTSFDCCEDPTCPPGCDVDCPPNCDFLSPLETVSKPAAPKTCDSATMCCTTACAND
jgi:hypothetical protein